MGVSIRRATVECAQAILELYSSLSLEDVYTRFLGFHKVTQEEVVHTIESCISVLVAESDGKLIAEASLHPDGEFSIVVHPSYRSLGIGAHLVRRIIETASQSGLREVHFHTLPSNLPMLRIGERLGFSLSFLGGEASGSLFLEGSRQTEVRTATQ
jgi:N-acetylglutamate synthase-like GNAT family acetyltransferase